MNEIILRAPDAEIERRAKRAKIKVAISSDLALPFERALIVEPGTLVPWDLLGAGYHFLERWDAAAPLWRYSVLAKDIGQPSERKRTEKIARDLRVPIIASELLFVRNSAAGRSLIETWQQERTFGDDARLAFLRALYTVKPLFCALPRLWLAPVRITRQVASRRSRATSHRGKSAQRTGILVRVKIAKGVYVRCHPGDEDKVRARFVDFRKTRRERRAG